MITYYINNSGYEVSDRWVSNCWTSVECPNEEEIGFLINGLDIPESFISDIDDNEERPRREEEDNWQLIVIRVPCHRNESHIDYTTVPFGIIMRGDVFVTICNYKVDMIDDFAVYTIRKQLQVANNDELVMRLFLSSSVWYLKYLKHINIRMMNVERELQQSVHNKEILELQRLENSLVYFVTSLKGNGMLFYRMAHTKSIHDNCDEELLEDVEIELKQAEDTTNIYRNIIHSMSNSYSSVISNNINQTMKQLTSISIVMMLPTLIASLYGMNVPNYLEEYQFAFPFIIVGALFASLILYLMLKKRDLF
ncbi:MAG: magnesium transporter CorA family protein [Marinilabiliaceae bacterium]|nr:magnesium transporter CorA family protein [Marinilabiliaceae bacterium]